MKKFVQRTMRRFGLELRRTRYSSKSLMDFIIDRHIDIVLDVGANTGQFGESLRALGYRGEIVSFEPIWSVYQILAEKTASDHNWTAHNFGLGDESTEATINVSEYSVFSSLLPVTQAAAHFDGNAVTTHPETIYIRTLDQVCPSLDGNALLKIDTQGYEKSVLDGAKNIIPRLKGILMELPIVHLYKDVWQLSEAIEFMAGCGFVPAQMHPVNYHPSDQVSMVEVDCLFRQRDRWD